MSTDIRTTVAPKWAFGIHKLPCFGWRLSAMTFFSLLACLKVCWSAVPYIGILILERYTVTSALTAKPWTLVLRLLHSISKIRKLRKRSQDWFSELKLKEATVLFSVYIHMFSNMYFTGIQHICTPFVVNIYVLHLYLTYMYFICIHRICTSFVFNVEGRTIY